MSAVRLPPALLALSPGDLTAARVEAFVLDLRRTVGAGLRGLLLREPRLSDRAYLGLARDARRALARDAGGWLGVHDRAHLAWPVDADGVHLGGRSLVPPALAPWLAEDLALGLSSHAGDDPARWARADYLVHAPLFEVPGKGAPLGPAGLARCVRAAGVPVWALGGVLPSRVGEALDAGAAGVAVLRGVFGSGDPVGATRAYLEALEAHSPSA